MLICWGYFCCCIPIVAIFLYLLNCCFTVEGNLEGMKDSKKQLIIIKPEQRDSEAADAVAHIQVENRQGTDFTDQKEEVAKQEENDTTNQGESVVDTSQNENNVDSKQNIVASLQDNQEGIIMNPSGNIVAQHQQEDIVADTEEDVMDTPAIEMADTPGMITMVEQSSQDEDDVEDDGESLK